MKIILLTIFLSLPLSFASYQMLNTTCMNCENQAGEWYVTIQYYRLNYCILNYAVFGFLT